jgi:transcription termination factor Rho
MTDPIETPNIIEDSPAEPKKRIIRRRPTPVTSTPEAPAEDSTAPPAEIQTAAAQGPDGSEKRDETSSAPIEQEAAPRPEPQFGEGIIEVSGKGFGFLRDAKRNFVQSPQDIFVTPEAVRRFSLRDGLWIKGEIRRGNRGPQLFRLTEINHRDPESYRNIPLFEELTTINPNSRIKL